jgi:hypothetical protein
MKLIIMKKSLLILATVATLTACSNDSVRENIAAEQVEIDFSTYTQKAVGTKADATTVGLEKYYTEFTVYGWKTVKNEETGANEDQMVFNAQSVNYVENSNSWTYSPKKFWDKVASKYNFYAAVPVGNDGFSFNETDRIFEIEEFVAEGKSLAVETAQKPDASISFVEVETDLMIADAIERDMNTQSAKTRVDFKFNHILSRLNVGVKCDGLEDGQTMTLNSLKIGGIVSKGSFNENDCWALSTEGSDVVTLVNAVEDATTNTVAITAENKFVYQGLLIPQEAGYSEVALDGTGKEETPYLYINYTIDNEKFYAYYNLAALFGVTENNSLEFQEGYQNNLYITIGASSIEFDANAYVWQDDNSSNLEVNESIKEE